MRATPIYQLPYPEFTDHVDQGASNIQDLATDTETMIDRHIGMVKIIPTPTGHTNITFDSQGNGTPLTGVATFTVNNVFSTAFNAYRFHWFGMRITASFSQCYARLVSSSAGVTYQTARITVAANSSGVFGYGTTTFRAEIGTATNSTAYANIAVFDVLNPAQSVRSGFYSNWFGYSSFWLENGWVTTIVDSTVSSISLEISTSNTLTQAGRVAIYGYNL